MALKLTKKEIDELTSFHTSISEAWAEVEDVTNDAAEKIGAIIAEVVAAREQYEGRVSDAKAYADEVLTRLDEEFEDKSDNWKEGERGESVREWIDELQNHFSEADEVAVADDIESFEIELPNDVSHLFDGGSIEAEPSY